MVTPQNYEETIMDRPGFRDPPRHKAFPVDTAPKFWDSMVKGNASIQMKKSMGEEM